MPKHLLLFAVLSLLSVSARADDAVECDKSRDVCDGKILELCPSGADVLDERELPATGNVPRYRITFRCRNAGAAELPVAPPPVEESVEGVPPAQVAGAEETQDELARVDARLASLLEERRQHSIVGPLILTGAGVGATVLFLGLAVAAKSDADALDDGFVNEFGEDQDDADSYRTTAKVAGGLAVVSFAVAAGGGVWLWRRLVKRNEHKAEIDELKDRRDILRSQVSYGFALDPSTRSLVLSGRF